MCVRVAPWVDRVRPVVFVDHRALKAIGTYGGKIRSRLACEDGLVLQNGRVLAENRDLVRLGLGALGQTNRPGLLALYEVAGVKHPETINAETIGWVLGPRINAAGRMEHARIALELLLAEDLATARTHAKRLEELNRQRRDDTANAVATTQNSSANSRLMPIIGMSTPRSR